jgi:hypothetical protein
MMQVNRPQDDFNFGTTSILALHHTFADARTCVAAAIRENAGRLSIKMVYQSYEPSKRRKNLNLLPPVPFALLSIRLN